MVDIAVEKRHRTFLGIRLSAIFETLIFLIVVTFLNFLFGDGKRFIGMSLHPFWIIILLVTVQYGTIEGLFAVLMSTLFLYAWNIPQQKIEESLFDYQFDLAFLPCLWFITAFVLGELRMRLGWENEKLRKQYVQAKNEAETIASAYNLVKDANANLEIHLTSQEKTAAATYRTFKSLSSQDPAQIIFGIEPIVETALSPQKFSVYAFGPNGFEATTSHGWTKADHFVRRFKPDSQMYQAVAEKRNMICVVNKADKKILGSEGLGGGAFDRQRNRRSVWYVEN